MGQLQPHANVIALHRLQIASPCTASWEQMAGDERVRHCGGCDKNVFNLSAMPEAEAASLLAEQRAGGVCVRFYRRADGTVMTSDCGAPSAGSDAAWRTLPGLATAAMLAMSLAAWTDLGIAREVVRSYRLAGGDDTPIGPPDLGQSMMIGLDWVAFNVERAIGLRPTPAAAASLARELVPGLLAAIPAQAAAAAQISL